jgi:NAD(P)-dependent dehydrogenase (short-subunit alcohol dehydrogenase family)
LTDGTDAVGQVEAMSLDLASLASVRAFAVEFAKRMTTGTMPSLHAVVCNAGLNPGTKKTTTVDGFESTFGVNHLGHFLLVNELLPSLQPPARVVVVASGVHDPAQKSGCLPPPGTARPHWRAAS